MKPIKEFMCDYTKPSDKEIEEAVSIASTEDCVVKLYYNYPYSGNYKVYVHPNETVEEVKEKLPKCYAVYGVRQ